MEVFGSNWKKLEVFVEVAHKRGKQPRLTRRFECDKPPFNDCLNVAKLSEKPHLVSSRNLPKLWLFFTWQEKYLVV